MNLGPVNVVFSGRVTLNSIFASIESRELVPQLEKKKTVHISVQIAYIEIPRMHKHSTKMGDSSLGRQRNG